MTSAEPGRTVAYCADIRWRVVWQRVGMGLSFKVIATRLQIGIATAHRLYGRYVQTGDVAPTSQPKRLDNRKVDGLHELYIIALVHENPAVYLCEICSKIKEATGVVVSGSTVCKVIHRNGFSRKKLMKVALQRSEGFRGAFFANVLQFPRDFFVWVDETGSDRRDQLRKFGYSVRGLPAVSKHFLTRGTRISAIVAMSADGVEAYEMSVGTTNSMKFFDFLRGSLIPSMNTFPGKHSILILDNCTIHHSQHIKDFLHSMEILPFYLPPYSPDLNPIEELFSYMKYYLKQHEDLIESLPSPIPVIEAALDSVTSAHCTGWINHSNYDK
ncbi:MAG: IS630 family transposase [Nitrosopumilus sp.]|nr:IS630 family transposase [Nitrosopumilus sp.]